MSTNLRENITTRYGEPEKDIYQQVIDLVKSNNIPKSRAQLLLVKRGLQHTNNPEPLIKEKVVYRDRPGKTIEKVVYRDKESIPSKHLGIQEHIGVDDHITEQPASSGQAQDSGQGKSTPNTALGVKKSTKEEKGIGGWIALGGFLAILFGPMVYSWLTK